MTGAVLWCTASAAAPAARLSEAVTDKRHGVEDQQLIRHIVTTHHHRKLQIQSEPKPLRVFQLKIVVTKTLPFVKLQPDGRIWPLPPEGKPSEVIHYRLQMIWYIHFISDMDTRIASLTMSMMYWWCGKIFKSDGGIPLRIISILLYLKLKHIPNKIKVWVGWSQIHCNAMQCRNSRHRHVFRVFQFIRYGSEAKFNFSAR